MEFISTKKYLPMCMQTVKLLTDICDAVDDVCFKPMYDDIVLKNAIYAQHRYDLATEATFDEYYEMVFSDVYGLPYPWPVKELNGEMPNDWAKTRIYLHTLVAQLMSLPYTMATLTKFAEMVEKELHLYEGDEPWLRVTFPSEGDQNLLWVIRDGTVGASEAVNAVHQETADKVVYELCRRICPCMIHVCQREIGGEYKVVPAVFASGTVGEEYSQKVSVTGTFYGRVTAMEGLPNGLEFNAETQTVVGTPEEAAAEQEVTVTIEDEFHTKTDTATISIAGVLLSWLTS